MLETLSALFFAHCLADYALQTRWINANKARLPGFAAHGAIVLATLFAATGDLSWPLLGLAALHMLIDFAKTRVGGQSLGAYLGDQALHIATLFGFAALLPDTWSNGAFAEITWLPAAFLLAAGLIYATRAGQFAVAILIDRHCRPSDAGNRAADTALLQPGARIGNLERGLVFVAVMVGLPAAIGGLIAIKALILVLSDRATFQVRRPMVFGTLASFAWALAISALIGAGMASLPAPLLPGL